MAKLDCTWPTSQLIQDELWMFCLLTFVGHFPSLMAWGGCYGLGFCGWFRWESAFNWVVFLSVFLVEGCFVWQLGYLSLGVWFWVCISILVYDVKEYIGCLSFQCFCWCLLLGADILKLSVTVCCCKAMLEVWFWCLMLLWNDLFRCCSAGFWFENLVLLVDIAAIVPFKDFAVLCCARYAADYAYCLRV